MKLSRSDLALLRWSILAICATVSISAAAVYGSRQYAEQALRELSSARLRFNDARTHLTAAHDDRNNVSAYSGEYRVLEQRKIIGDGQRLDWIEGLENLRQQHLVTNFHYLIAPQKIYPTQAPIERGNFDIRYNEMKLQFDLLHEVQLLEFFTALRNQVNGWYQLEGCSLHRAITAENAAAAYLKAECTGGWVTLTNRTAQQ